MERDPDANQRSRENTLAVSQVVIVSGMVLFFLYIISLGVIGNVLAGGAILVIVGALHYLIWGHAFSREVAAERDALQREDAHALAPAPKPNVVAIQAKPEAPRETSPSASEGIQDMSHTKGIAPDR